MSPKRGAYPRDFREAALAELRKGRDLNELARKLEVTPTTLKVWLSRPDGGIPRPTRRQVIEQTSRAYERLDQVLSSLPASALQRPMQFQTEYIDPWGVKDAVAHVTHYKVWKVLRLMQRTQSEVSTKWDGPMDDYFAPDKWHQLNVSDELLPTLDSRKQRRHGPNHLVYVRWKDRRPRDIVSWHRTVHEFVISALKKAPAHWFTQAGHRSSPPGLSLEDISSLGLHLDQHLKDIRRTLAIAE